MLKFSILKLGRNLPEYLFYLFAFLLPWQTRWIIQDSYTEYGRISLYGFDIVLIVLLLYYFIVRKNRNWKIKKSIVVSCLLLVVYCLLSVVWADEKIISLYWGVRMILGLGLFWLIQNINFSKVRLAVTVVMAGAIQGLLGIWQFVDQSVWGSKWLGMAEQSAWNLGTSVVEFGLERWLRAYGSLPHPNIYGALLVLSFIGVIYLISKIEDPPASLYEALRVGKYHKLFLIFSSSFIWLGILFSYSRAAWIGLGLVFIWAIKKRWQNKFGRALFIYGLLLLALFTYTTWPIVSTRLGIGPATRLEAMAVNQRIDGLDQAGEIIKDNWLLGTGIGNYTFELSEEYPQAVHNVPLLILAELGVVGFLMTSIIFIYIIFNLIKRKKWSYVGLLLVVSCLLLFDHFWWTLGSGMYILWFILAINAKTLKE